MVFNATGGTSWINGDPGWSGSSDLFSVAAHEAGHWIGFDHNNYPGSTLQAFYSNGTADRTLTCDDTEGVCALYPGSGNSCTADYYCDCGVTCASVTWLLVSRSRGRWLRLAGGADGVSA